MFILGFARGGQHKRKEVVNTYISKGDGFGLFEVFGSMCLLYTHYVHAMTCVRLCVGVVVVSVLRGEARATPTCSESTSMTFA